MRMCVCVCIITLHTQAAFRHIDLDYTTSVAQLCKAGGAKVRAWRPASSAHIITTAIPPRFLGRGQSEQLAAVLRGEGQGTGVNTLTVSNDVTRHAG